MKKLLFILTIAILAACSSEKKGQFHVEGHIAGACDSTLYLEHFSLANGIELIDSTVLSDDETFAFAADTIANPEFYRLRIGEQSINLAFDSTETVRIEAEMSNMSFGYRVEGSGACDTIRLLSLKLAGLESAIQTISTNESLSFDQRDELIEDCVEEYKKEVKMQYISPNLASSASYYACFQVLGNAMIFNPTESKDDYRWMLAVANTWYERFPQAPRAQNFANILAQCRGYHKKQEIVLDSSNEKIRELGIIDMTMPDANGTTRTLSDLRGQVVLLDFTAYELPQSQERTLLIRELYDKYHSRGLQIYQVSLDHNRHYWQQRVKNVPWINVFCEEGQNSDMLRLYMVDRLPYYFLIDRNCDLQARMENIDDLEKAIEKLL